MANEVSRSELTDFLNDLLGVNEYNDYGPNGLQIEGREKIRKVAFAVSAQRNSIESACAWKADAMVVHHGLFWKFHGARTLTGPFARRVLPLVRNEINLLGYHLPLDAHKTHGNAAGIARALELEDIAAFGDYKGMPTGLCGSFKEAIKGEELRDKLKNILGHEVLYSNPESEMIESVGIITGGANGQWTESLNLGICAYITGEMSEHDYHESREAGIHMFAGGHNATERFGVLSLKSLIEKKFGLECMFFDSENPA